MSTAPKNPEKPYPVELQSGDHMTREDFHRVYEGMPDHFKAELIGGIVYVASPLKVPHGQHHLLLGTLLCIYQGNTCGVQACDNATVFLTKDDETQPDLFMRILPEHGGQSRNTSDQYVEGAPEFIAEIAHSSWSIDLHSKRDRYSQAGVLEYLVVCLQPKQIRMFDVTGEKEVVSAAGDGILRSTVFPGLWIDGEALLALNYQRLLDVLNQGLKTAAHTQFVASLKDQQK